METGRLQRTVNHQEPSRTRQPVGSAATFHGHLANVCDQLLLSHSAGCHRLSGLSTSGHDGDETPSFLCKSSELKTSTKYINMHVRVQSWVPYSWGTGNHCTRPSRLRPPRLAPHAPQPPQAQKARHLCSSSTPPWGPPCPRAFAQAVLCLSSCIPRILHLGRCSAPSPPLQAHL